MRLEPQRNMASRSALLLLFIGLFASLISAVSLTGQRVLVVLEEAGEKESYSQFLGDLEGELCN
jgi:oligosaccharyltransferase complex subunit beta